MSEVPKKVVMATCTGSLPLAEYRKFKSYAALEGLKIADAVALAMREWVAARETSASVEAPPADQSKGE
jgi:hypothetical protein